jgi:hypothetical protein
VRQAHNNVKSNMVSQAKKRIGHLYRNDISTTDMNQRERHRQVEYLLESDRFQCRSDKYDVSHFIAFTMLTANITMTVNGFAILK